MVISGQESPSRFEQVLPPGKVRVGYCGPLGGVPVKERIIVIEYDIEA